jgi:hypothetical protein
MRSKEIKRSVSYLLENMFGVLTVEEARTSIANKIMHHMHIDDEHVKEHVDSFQEMGIEQYKTFEAAVQSTECPSPRGEFVSVLAFLIEKLLMLVEFSDVSSLADSCFSSIYGQPRIVAGSESVEP